MKTHFLLGLVCLTLCYLSITNSQSPYPFTFCDNWPGANLTTCINADAYFYINNYTLYVTCLDGNGFIRRYQTPNSTITGEYQNTPEPNGNVFTVDQNQTAYIPMGPSSFDRIYIVNTAGSFVSDQIPVEATSISCVQMGPFNKLWAFSTNPGTAQIFVYDINSFGNITVATTFYTFPTNFSTINIQQAVFNGTFIFLFDSSQNRILYSPIFGSPQFGVWTKPPGFSVWESIAWFNGYFVFKIDGVFFIFAYANGPVLGTLSTDFPGGVGNGFTGDGLFYIQDSTAINGVTRYYPNGYTGPLCGIVSTTGIATTAVPTTAIPTTAVATTAIATTAVATTAVATTANPTTALIPTSTGFATTAVATTAVATTAVLTTAIATTAVATTAVLTTAVATTSVLTTAVASTGVATTGIATTAIATTGIPMTGQSVTTSIPTTGSVTTSSSQSGTEPEPIRSPYINNLVIVYITVIAILVLMMVVLPLTSILLFGTLNIPTYSKLKKNTH